MAMAAAAGDFGWEGRELSRVGFWLWWAWAVAYGLWPSQPMGIKSVGLVRVPTLLRVRTCSNG
jgi:hypothetical protein